jgi:hypothetical protein
MTAEVVSLEDREAVFAAAVRMVDEVAVRWLDARAGGTLTGDLDRELTVAQLAVKRADRALERTRRRIEKRTSKEAA